jgi:hypothetical protein
MFGTGPFPRTHTNNYTKLIKVGSKQQAEITGLCSTGGRVRVKPFCHNVHMSEVAMFAYRIVMVLVQYLTPLCIISCVYARMALRLWGSRAPGIAQESRDANLMRNKKKVSPRSAVFPHRLFFFVKERLK